MSFRDNKRCKEWCAASDEAAPSRLHTVRGNLWHALSGVQDPRSIVPSNGRCHAPQHRPHGRFPRLAANRPERTGRGWCCRCLALGPMKSSHDSRKLHNRSHGLSGFLPATVWATRGISQVVIAISGVFQPQHPCRPSSAPRRCTSAPMRNRYNLLYIASKDLVLEIGTQLPALQ